MPDGRLAHAVHNGGAMARHPAIAIALLLVSTGACIDRPDVTTDPAAHESPPLPPAALQTLSRSTFLGGSGTDLIDDVIKGSDDIIYVVGGTASPDFPTTDGSVLDGTATAGCSACPFDAFAAAIGVDGRPIWVRLFSTPGHDRFTSAALVGQTLFVAGAAAERTGIPGWRGGAEADGVHGEQDGVVCALSIATGEVERCRYVGGTGGTGITDLGINGAGDALTVVMISPEGENLHLDPDYSASFLFTARGVPAGGDDALVLSLTAGLTIGSNPRWAAYVGGTADEYGTPALTVVPSGSENGAAVVLTQTRSLDAPINGFQIAPADGDSAYLAQLNRLGTELGYSTYVGGNGIDRVAPNTLLDLGGDLVFGISTTSTDLPTSPFAQQAAHGGNGGAGCGDGDVWLGRVATGVVGTDSFLNATYLGGAQGERITGITLSTLQFSTAFMITGVTYSTTFPTMNAAQPLFGGQPCTVTPESAEGFVANLAWTLDVADSTFLGGAAWDSGTAVARGFGDRTIVAGVTDSTNFPVTGPGDLGANGGRDGFIAEYGQLPFNPQPGDAGSDAFPNGDGGGNPGADGGDGPYTEDGGFCVCGTGGSPSAAAAPLVLVLGFLLFRRRRPR
jgi:MYXO-CTERM domain-containing protein